MSAINTNISAIAAARNLNRTQDMLGRSLSRLSSGSKIVNPADDAAGLAKSGKLDAQGLRVKAATTNVQNAISFVQTADSFMGGMTKMLSRMSELGALAKDGTKNSADVALYQQEFEALQNQLRATIGGDSSEIGGAAVANPSGAFNGLTLFGSSEGLTVTIGQTAGQDATIAETNLRVGPMHDLINQDSTGAFTLKSTDAGAIDSVTGAIAQIATQRATLGGAQSRLQLAAKTLEVEYENLTSAASSIRDVDVANESTQYAKYNILMQSGTAMLAQANQTPQSVLKLLQN